MTDKDTTPYSVPSFETDTDTDSPRRPRSLIDDIGMADIVLGLFGPKASEVNEDLEQLMEEARERFN